MSEKMMSFEGGGWFGIRFTNRDIDPYSIHELREFYPEKIGLPWEEI